MVAAAEQSKFLKEGDYAPDFVLNTDGGHSVTLSKLKGKTVIVYFYPKDDTPGCTIEAKDFTEFKKDFDDCDAKIIGISRDNIEKHDKFKGKYDLSFTLASDEDGSVCEGYGVWVEKNMYGKKYMGIQRTTFLIDKNGIISKIWPKVKVTGHAEEVLEAARDID